MASTTQSMSRFTFKLPTFASSKTKLVWGYLGLLVLPFLATYALDMDGKTTYAALLSLVNTIAMMAFYIQFPLASRLKRIALFANIDWNMAQHKRVGQWLGFIFLLHPMLILAPRFLMSYQDGVQSVITTITAPQMLTGVIAWVGMIVWILTSIFKNKLPMSYETWRVTHMLGFVAIAILATLHVTTVGSHGQFQPKFNLIWWSLCSFSVAMVLFNYLVKPTLKKAKPFELMQVQPVSSTDWQVSLKAPANFEFEPGQFVWLNTSTSGGVKEHPFSIASAKNELPTLSFIIRNLGDYTSQLGSLEVGQQVYVDGPYGSVSLSDTANAKAILLIAGGAGIGPMLSLVRGLAEQKEQRPVRLIYGNNRADQMVLQEELKALEQSMPDFSLRLACVEPNQLTEAYPGVIDYQCIAPILAEQPVTDWGVYLCGPKPMLKAVNKTLKTLKVPASNVHYERLSF